MKQLVTLTTILVLALIQSGCAVQFVVAKSGMLAGRTVGKEVPGLATCCIQDQNNPEIWFSGYNDEEEGDVFIIFYTSTTEYADTRRIERLRKVWTDAHSGALVLMGRSIQEAPIFSTGPAMLLQSKAAFRGIWLQVRKR